MLPALPHILHIHPNRLSAEQADARRGRGCHTSDTDVTFEALFASLGALPGWRAIDAWGSRFVVRALLTASRGRLASAAQDAFGVRATHEALMELRVAGVTSNKLSGGESSAEFKDLAGLLGAYEDALESAHLHDAADTQRQAVFDVVQGALPDPWSQVQRIEVAAGTELFGARLDLLNAFCARGVRVDVVLPWDEARAPAFAWPEAMLHALETRGHQTMRVRYNDRLGDGPLQPLRAVQFAGRHVAQAPVSVLQVADGDEHRQQVLAQIVVWLRSGVPPHAIAIVTPAPALALPLVKHLARAGVPAFTRRGTPLGESRAAQLVLGAIEAVDQGMPRESLIELWLACGLTVPTPDGPWAPRRVVAEMRRLRLRACMPGALRAAWMADRGRVSASQATIDAVSQAVDSFVERLLHLPLTGALDAALLSLLQVLVDAAVPREADTFMQVRHTLLQLMQAARLAPQPPRFERRELADWLRLAFAEQRQAPPGVRSGAVRVLSPDEMVGTQFEKVFVVGANVGVFPRLAPTDPVLTDFLRHEVNARLGPRLVQYGPLLGRGALPGDARDTWLWLEILASCQNEMVVSCAPGEDDAGPSELVDELLRSTRTTLAAPQVSYLLPHPPSVSLWMQAWAISNPQRGLTAGGALPWEALDASVSAHLSLRHGRMAQAMATLWDRKARGGRLAAMGDSARAALKESVLGRVQSTSRIDALGMCRYKHFASGILRLGKEDVPTLSANPREQGSIAHAGLHIVYRDIRERGGFAQARLQPEATVVRASEVFWQDTSALLQDAVVHPLLQKSTLLHAWQAVQTQLERDLSASGAEPVALEYRFDDRDGADGAIFVLPHPEGSAALRVRGSIDRVDVLGDGLETLDYKRTLSTRTPGRHFQLAIYGAVAQRDVLPAAATVSAAWLGLWDGRVKRAGELTGDAHTVGAYLNEHLWSRLDTLLQGEISPDPDGDDLCGRCDFAALCRYPNEGRDVAMESV